LKGNTLAQQASGYEVRKGLFVVKEKLMITMVDAARNESVEAGDRVRSATRARTEGLSSIGDMSTVG
jgi:hypothetical protein